MKVQRLFEIVYLLAHRHTMTAPELAGRLGVSTRTILRDIETLSGAGVPVYSTRGHGGGIHLLDRYVLDRTVLNASEQAHILAGLRALAETTEDADATLSRLRSLFAIDETAWLEIDLSRWGAEDADRATFAVLREAILGRFAVEFDYASQHREKRHTVFPLKLAYKSRAWYTHVARADGQFRTFKLTRMTNLVAHPESTTPEGLGLVLAEADLAARRRTPGSPVPSPEASAETVRLRISPDLRHRVLDEYDPAAVVSTDDGFLVTIRVPVDLWLRGHILSYGPDAEVLAPDSLRDEIAAAARAVTAQYDK